MQKLFGYIVFTIMIFVVLGCSTNRPQVIVITSTALPAPIENVTSSPAALPSATPIVSTPVNSANILTPLSPTSIPEQYIVKAGDTLSQIAELNNVSLPSLIALNQIANPNLLEVGQVLLLPAPPTTFTSSTQIVPDSRVVRAPNSGDFEVRVFINNQTGYIKTATDIVDTRLSDGSTRKDLLSASDVINRVAMEYSVDERLLLAFLEYRAQWITIPELSDERTEFPLISESNSAGFDRKGLYKQLSWLANEINRGYYGRKYRGWDVISFADGTQYLYQPSLNAGSVALQYVLGLNTSVKNWQLDVSENGFVRLYESLFGNVENEQQPFIGVLEQPELNLPFRQGDVWLFTGGFHGGWGSGSAWSALDFVPPDERQSGDAFCYISEYPITSVASGIIARNSNGSLVLDLDGDGNERTGWTILYLHVTVDPSISIGQRVSAGDELGYASCYGGFSTATHIHIARRYNGEWIPADCQSCSDIDIPQFIMSDWQAVGLVGQEYQGFMVNRVDNRRIVAEQSRNTEINKISW